MCLPNIVWHSHSLGSLFCLKNFKHLTNYLGIPMIDHYQMKLVLSMKSLSVFNIVHTVFLTGKINQSSYSNFLSGQISKTLQIHKKS